MLVLPPDRAATPAELPADAAWREAPVPGTALAAMGIDASAIAIADAALPRLHDFDVWYRAELDAEAGERIVFHGLAGRAEIWLGSDLVARASSMFLRTSVTVRVAGRQTIAIRFAALSRALAAPLPRARWRTRLVSNNALRGQRQTLLGHMPGWCPPCHAVGPYRPVERIRSAGTLTSCQMSTRMVGRDGILTVRVAFAHATGIAPGLAVRVGGREAPIAMLADGAMGAELRLPEVERWWPHTHGRPVLHDVDLRDGDETLPLGRVGFRDLRVHRGDDGRGFAFVVNEVAIFCRGACWSSADLVGLGGAPSDYRRWLELARIAGMNMLRVGGTMLYEDRAFHDICDELGILVWQDLMFANSDVPIDLPAFRADVVSEVEQLIERIGGSPSLAMVCGGSEMAQQATLLGLDADRRRLAFFEDDLPALLSGLAPGLPYVPNSPWGGALPTALGTGICHYYGVGAYLRPIEDARRAGVRFATECLALANPATAGTPSAGRPDDVPRDPGAAWDFTAPRDHYLRTLYGEDPKALRADDPDRYAELSRAVTADLMEIVFAEWRRPGSGCAGGLVWQLQDVARGSGWGVVDSDAEPKPAWHGLRRVLAPIQILLSDEGLDGLGVHVLNETADHLALDLELCCLRRGSVPVATGTARIEVDGRGSVSLSSQTLLGRFFDISRAWHFGPAEHDVTVASLRARGSAEILSQAFHFPDGRLLPRVELDLVATVRRAGDQWCLHVTTGRFAQAVYLVSETHRAEADWFHLPPGRERSIALHARASSTETPRGSIHAINGMHPSPLRMAA